MDIGPIHRKPTLCERCYNAACSLRGKEIRWPKGNSCLSFSSSRLHYLFTHADKDDLEKGSKMVVLEASDDYTFVPIFTDKQKITIDLGKD